MILLFDACSYLQCSVNVRLLTTMKMRDIENARHENSGQKNARNENVPTACVISDAVFHFRVELVLK